MRVGEIKYEIEVRCSCQLSQKCIVISHVQHFINNFLLFLKQGSKARFRLPPYGLYNGAEAFRQAHSFAFPGLFFPNNFFFFQNNRANVQMALGPLI